MNRQLRRAQAKMDRKAEQEKQDRKDARVRKLEKLRTKRAARRDQIRANAEARRRGEPIAKDAAKGAGKDTEATGENAGAAAKPGRKPGRFSGALTIATIFFIVLQASVPVEEAGNPILRSVTGAGFYLLFGYFSMLWSMRREVPRPLVMTWVTGGMLVLGVEIAKLVQGVPTDWLLLAIAVPAMVGGTFLGKLVFENTPA